MARGGTGKQKIWIKRFLEQLLFIVKGKVFATIEVLDMFFIRKSRAFFVERDFVKKTVGIVG